MSQRNITDLTRPPLPYRPDKAKPPYGKAGFESEKASREEDRLRARGLRTLAKERDEDMAFRATFLAESLDRGADTGSPPTTTASHLYMRDKRIHVIGRLWQLLSDLKGPMATFTLIPKDGVVDDLRLFNTSAAAFMSRFRSDMNRKGATEAPGFLFAGLHGEYDATTGEYHLHYHGVVYGEEMIAVLERLREVRRFKLPPDQKKFGLGKKRPPVHITRKSLSDLPHPLTYQLQSYWPDRTTVTLESGVTVRAGRSRIPEPAHSKSLIWLDRQPLEEMTLLMGLRVTRSGFLPTKL